MSSGGRGMDTHANEPSPRTQSRTGKEKRDAVLPETGGLACEARGFDLNDRYGEHGWQSGGARAKAYVSVGQVSSAQFPARPVRVDDIGSLAG